MSEKFDASLSDDATFAGRGKRPQAEVSLSDEQTLGGGDAAGLDTVIADSEIVDLAARYTIEGTLGQGGMGAVLLATDTRLGRKVAIKRILGEAARSQTATQRFLTEAKAIAALNHPNVVQIHDYGQAKDGPFLIMEYVDGGSLADRCKQAALPLEEAVDLACQLCDGLAKAHDAGIIHRDIKPANVLLSKDGLPKLTDFGLAKAEASDHGMTMTGSVMGTPDFMPPEQRRDASLVDHRSDLWSLAASVYQMVTGRSPKIIRFNDVPESLQDVLGKALEEEKDARYQSAREFRDGLKQTVQIAAAVVPPTADETVEGRCPACGTINTDLARKFCRNASCGASLRTDCLKCESSLPVWETICGECGGHQANLLAELRQAFEEKQTLAEQRLSEFVFGEAADTGRELSAISVPQLADVAEWGRAFSARVSEEKERQAKLAAEKLQEAKAHQKAFDYPAAIHSLETIPQVIRSSDVLGLLADCTKADREAARVVETIANRIQRKEIDGLLPLVKRALELRGDRKDLAKIRDQLIERRDARLARAQAAMEAGDARSAAHALSRIAMEDLLSVQNFVVQVQRAAAAEQQLIAAVKSAKADGVVDLGEAQELQRLAERCLSVHPGNGAAQRVVQQTEDIIQRHLQRWTAGNLRAEEIRSLTPLRNSIGMELRLLPAGRFNMSSNRIVRIVRISRPFYIGVYVVTNSQMQAVMGDVPSKWKGADLPVESVSWEDATEFCRRLSALPEEEQAGRVYRLPTEAEWEYACRVGKTNEYYSFGDDESMLDEHAWFDANSGGQTHPVGQKRPNAWGLYDMHGNVWEWCGDWYEELSNGVFKDPQGSEFGSFRVLRGGGWYNTARFCRSANRCGNSPSHRSSGNGFRLALSLSGASSPEAGD